MTFLTSFAILFCLAAFADSQEGLSHPTDYGGWYLPRALSDKRTLSTQINTLTRNGYNIDKLDNHTQLKVFLYTWMAMERGEGG